MFLTTVNLAAKAKSKYILVQLVSAAGTGYTANRVRLRLAEKLVMLKHDPIVNKHVLFHEKKKIRSV
ncbi:large ribosomal subunit protein bL33m [Austrofundulus limnaeus]|uniref:Large ribosomal subunit protein bL33m n=1 Tax=Austrofundulus limnaeus TaxID=52670 RepID=A0A2I4BCM7_AUSLI|nr:PREDICTED: 39S ribosomal protein L33, mitochondrial [Austrofundulus limnaeus]